MAGGAGEAVSLAPPCFIIILFHPEAAKKAVANQKRTDR
jgi:hypothetical protein